MTDDILDKVPLNLFKFAYCKNFDKKIEDLANLAIEENWGNEENGKKYPVLYNYIRYTYQKIAEEFNTAEKKEEKTKKIFFKNDLAYINTGLYTKLYDRIFMVFKRNKNPNYQPYFLLGFFSESGKMLEGIADYELPERASYFNDPSELIFDYRLTIRSNKHHILVERKERLPAEFQNPDAYNKLVINYEGAVSTIQKKLAANYKLAVPQYYWKRQYSGCIQLLIPISLTGEKIDFALAIQKVDGKYYEAKTCLTLSMAYNNARLIVRPESDWLQPS